MNRKLVVCCAALALLMLLPLLPAQAQGTRVSFYITIEGVRQGKFKGESVRQIHRDKLEGVRWNYSVSSPRDLASGQASGKRQHQPIIITKEWGASSPQLFQALATNEVLRSVVFEFVRSAPTGQEYVYQTVKLTNATISSIRQYIGVANPGEPFDPRPLEDVAFTFQKIEMSNLDGKTMAMDDWMR